MKLLKFESKKVVKQKKYVWAFLAVFLITSALFWMNAHQRSRLQGNWARYQASGVANPLVLEWSKRESELITLRDQQGLTEVEEKQLQYSREIGFAVQRMRMCYSYEMWGDVFRYEKFFLDNLQKYAEYGGEFSVLDGIDREIAIKRNQWFLEHELPFELERAPLSQHLFLTESALFILGIIGIAILLVLFGNTITEEKESHTWMTIKTQPISKSKLILSKYIAALLMAVVFMVMVIVVGLLVPAFKEGWTLALEYPRVITEVDTFQIISTGQYLVRILVLFFCASSVAISISLLVSKKVSKSLILYLFMAIIMGIGYQLSSLIKTPLNPFYTLNTNHILNRVLTSGDWLFIILSTVFWSACFLTLSIHVPENKNKTLQAVRDNKAFAKGRVKSQRSILLNACTFEWRKLKREGLIRKLAVIMLALVIGGHFFISGLTESRENDYLAELKWRAEGGRVERYQEMLDFNREAREKFLEDLDLDEDDVDLIHYPYLEQSKAIIKLQERELAVEKQLQELAQEAKLSYQEGDWKTLYEYQIKTMQVDLDRAKRNDEIRGSDIERNFTELVSIHQKELHLEHNIKPILPGEYIPNIHQFWRTQGRRPGWHGEPVEQEEWERQNKNIDNSGLYYLYLSFTHYIYLLPLVLLLFFIGGGMAKEKGKKMTFNFLKTQPISQGKIFAAKLINTGIISLIIALCIPVVVVLVGTILNRFGDWNYPILYYNTYGETISPEYLGLTAAGHGYGFMSLGSYLLKAGILFVIMSLVIIMVSNIISIFIKRTIGVWILTLVTFVGGYWYTWRKPLLVSHLSPFTYFNIPKIINGEAAARLNDPRFSVATGVMVLFVTLAITILIGFFITTRKFPFKKDGVTAEQNKSIEQ